MTVTEAVTTGGPQDFAALNRSARRILGCEAIVILGTEGRRHPVVLGELGLEPRELEELSRMRVGQVLGFLDLGFEGILSADVTFGGTRYGQIHALKRASGPFENRGLIDAYAVQVAIALGMRGRTPTADQRPETWRLLDQLVLSAHSLEELGHALNDVIGPLFGGAQTGVMVADSQRNMLQMIPGAFGAPDDTTASHRMSFFDARSNSARVLMTGRPYISNVSEGDTGIRQEYVDVFHIERLLTVPLGQTGVLHLANGPREFDLCDLERAEALAPRIASVVELATELFQMRRQQRLEETLSSVAVAIASGEALQTFLPPALEEVCAATMASMVAMVPDEAPPICAYVGSRNATLERTVLDEADGDPGVRAYVVGPQKAGDPGWAVFYVPVLFGSTRVGTLAALRMRGEPFTRAERHSFVRLANLAALGRAAERYQQQRAELARLQERQRIADDLHDDVAQILFGAQLCLDSVLYHGTLDGETEAQLTRARSLLIRGDTAIRTVIHKLSGPAAADVGTRLASVVAGVEEEFSIAVHLEVAEDASVLAKKLRRPANDALVKVAREALVNAAKHAGPCSVGVSLALSRRDRLLLTVVDDGVGVRVPNGEHHHGLSSLRRAVRDQGGSLRMFRGQTGTRVTASMPVGDRRPAVGGAPDRPERPGRLAEATVAGG